VLVWGLKAIAVSIFWGKRPAEPCLFGPAKILGHGEASNGATPGFDSVCNGVFVFEPQNASVFRLDNLFAAICAALFEN